MTAVRRSIDSGSPLASSQDVLALAGPSNDAVPAGAVGRAGQPRRFAKRAFDLAIAVPTLLLVAPIIAVATAAIRLESPGSAFFSQPRVGRGRRSFRMYKLRTMRGATDTGPLITGSGDERVTKVGRLLRRSKIDELPQLWNVVRGDMSLVGPRPEHARFVDHYPDEWHPLLSVRPGLTDAACVAFRNEESMLRDVGRREEAYVRVVMPVKARVSLEGLQRVSVFDDVVLLIRTARSILPRRRGREHPAAAEVRKALVVYTDSPGL